MRKYTLKSLKNMISSGIAEDITNYGFEQINELRRTRNIVVIGKSYGKYGMTGALAESADTGERFAVIGRNSSLFQLA